MSPTIYRVESIGSGWLAIMARPRAGEWAADEFSALAELGVTTLVSLLEPAEARELDLHDESSLCAAASMEYRSFPIADRGVPKSAAELSKLACSLYHCAAGGGGVTVHCRAGIGRSGVVAAAVLLHGGHTVKEAFSQISGVRGLSVPDTTEQIDWLISNWREVSRCHLR